MFWPGYGETSGLEWSSIISSADVPSCGALVATLRPVLRALFLQGYKTDSVCFLFGPALVGPQLWEVLDLESLTISAAPRSLEPAATSLDIVFEVSEMIDILGPAPSGYGLAGVPTRLGYDGALGTKGKVPSALAGMIEDFTDAAIDRLTALVANRTVPRANHQGLLWIFDPAHLRMLPEDNRHAAGSIFGLLQKFPRDFIRAQVFDDQRKYGTISRMDATEASPTYRWLAKVANSYFLDFWPGIRSSLEDRGESERMKAGTEQRLSGPNAPSWLDVILELGQLGALSMDGLVDVVEPAEPLVARRIAADPDAGLPEVIELEVWGETTITLVRSIPTWNPALEDGYATGLDGSVAWEYVCNRGDRPKLVVVASRGIQVGTPKLMGHLPWDLDLYRVQDDALVPTAGSAINTTALLGAATLDPHPGELTSDFNSMQARVTARGKKDGLSLEFPAAATDPLPRLILELTLEDPRSGLEGYTVGLYYYDYRPAARLPLATGVHICVWATSGVKIESNGTGRENYQALAIQHFFTGWTASAEFWELDDSLGIEHINYPFRGELNFTRRLALNADSIESAFQPFSDDLSIKVVMIGGREGARLSPKFFTPKEYDDWFGYLLLDLGIGLVPVLGDLADIAELTLGLTTGMDKWGRPVTNFDLALMAIGSAVPFVSSSFVRGVKGALAGPLDDVFHGGELIDLYRHSMGFWNIAPERELAEAAARVSPSWISDPRWQQQAQADAVSNILDLFSRNADAIESFGRRFCEETGEAWLVLDDIYDAQGGGFKLNAIQAAYRRWQGVNGGAQDPERFVRSLRDDTNVVDATAKIVADALLGPHMVGVHRRTPQAAGWPSGLRASLPGEPMLVEELFEHGFRGAIDDFVAGALREGSAIQVVHAGMLRPVHELIRPTDRAFLNEVTELLLEDPVQAGTAEALITTLGNNLINGLNLSVRERAARFNEGLFIAIAEMRQRLLDARQLSTEEMLPQLREFVRSAINRGGHEIGSRFELSKVAELVLRLGSHANVEAIRTQLRMPLAETVPGWYHYLSGPDIVLYLRGQNVRRAVFVQLKAYRNLLALRREFFNQAFSDARRVTHPDWNGSVPGPDFAGRLGPLPPSQVNDWVESANVHVFQFDDDLVQDTLSSLILEARRRTGQATILSGHLDASDDMRAMFDELFPNGVPANSDDEVRNLIYNQTAWLDAWVARTEDWLNQQLRTVLDEPPEILVRSGTADPNEIVTDLLERIEEP